MSGSPYDGVGGTRPLPYVRRCQGWRSNNEQCNHPVQLVMRPNEVERGPAGCILHKGQTGLLAHPAWGLHSNSTVPEQGFELDDDDATSTFSITSLQEDVDCLREQLASTQQSNREYQDEITNLQEANQDWQDRHSAVVQAHVAAHSLVESKQAAEIHELERQAAEATRNANLGAAAAATAAAETVTIAAAAKISVLQSAMKRATQLAQAFEAELAPLKAEKYRWTVAALAQNTALAQINKLEVELEEMKQRDQAANARIAALEDTNRDSLDRANLAENAINNAHEVADLAMGPQQSAQHEIQRLRTLSQLASEQEGAGVHHKLQHLSRRFAALELPQMGNMVNLQSASVRNGSSWLGNTEAKQWVQKVPPVEICPDTKQKAAEATIRDLEIELKNMRQISKSAGVQAAIQAEADAADIATLMVDRDNARQRTRELLDTVTELERKEQWASRKAETVAAWIGSIKLAVAGPADGKFLGDQQKQVANPTSDQTARSKAQRSASIDNDFDGMIAEISLRHQLREIQSAKEEVQQRGDHLASPRLSIETTRTSGRRYIQLPAHSRSASGDSYAPVLARRSPNRSAGGW